MSPSSTRVPATSLYHVAPRSTRALPSTSVTTPISVAAFAAPDRSMKLNQNDGFASQDRIGMAGPASGLAARDAQGMRRY